MGITLGWDNIRLRELKKQKEKLKDELSNKKKNTNKKYLFPIIITAFGIVMSFMYFIEKNLNKGLLFSFRLIFIILGPSTIILLMFIKDLEITVKEEEILEINDEIELLETSENEYDKIAKKQFQRHQKEVKRYYDINLKHLKYLFPIGVGIILLGVTIIIISVILFINEKNGIQMLIGSVSGILIDFIGVIFIQMYTETVKMSLKFHDKLINSNNILFVNILITKIKNQDLQDKTLSEVAKIISKGNDEHEIDDNN
jgi:hypothetical protein